MFIRGVHADKNGAKSPPKRNVKTTPDPTGETPRFVKPAFELRLCANGLETELFRRVFAKNVVFENGRENPVVE